jgi:hypothetical protein
MSKKDKTTKKDYKLKEKAFGFFELLVVASVAFSTTIIVLGTDNQLNLVLVAPQALWAAFTLVKQFTK